MTCEHHYLIAPPTSAFSQGVCLKCGAKRQFSNVFIQDRNDVELHWTSRAIMSAESQRRGGHAKAVAAAVLRKAGL